MNDIKFLEKYNEAAIDNFVAVVKQNILFQAQVAYLSDQVAHTDELRKQIADFESQYQWFLGLGFLLLLVDVFLLEKKTNWVQKLNLFNET